MSSGERLMNKRAGPTARTKVTSPKTDHVGRQPSQTMSDAAKRGIQTFAKPTPMLERARARPRRRKNHCAMTMFTTMEPIIESPRVTKVKRTNANCVKVSTWPSKK